MKPQDAKAKILELSGLTEEEYFFMKIDTGFEYLRDIVKAEERDVQAFAESKLFWAWWVNLWERRDIELCHSLRVNQLHYPTYTKQIDLPGGDVDFDFVVFTCEEDFLSFYRQKHAPRGLNIYLNKHIIAEARMKNQVTGVKNSVKKLLKINY